MIKDEVGQVGEGKNECSKMSPTLEEEFGGTKESRRKLAASTTRPKLLIEASHPDLSVNLVLICFAHAQQEICCCQTHRC